ncbi:MAG TPA: hypothetical protein VFU31_06720 [Candidatus Binatia bacterium]|nr:hypothetical protein [Candidatus Binatia bacterium]
MKRLAFDPYDEISGWAIGRGRAATGTKNSEADEKAASVSAAMP